VCGTWVNLVQFVAVAILCTPHLVASGFDEYLLISEGVFDKEDGKIGTASSIDLLPSQTLL
jgi:hypothetical protein